MPMELNVGEEIWNAIRGFGVPTSEPGRPAMG